MPFKRANALLAAEGKGTNYRPFISGIFRWAGLFGRLSALFADKAHALADSI